ncbi:phage major tail tube protein [Lachnotalea glycerini]|uniref:Phage tail protein n=1 Tax=Lachnotalea glycerini TaxID=1763509 RepID=A0A371J7L6_9FIRM|nr:phage major tail tube protein [Lachnotalea glycerini]RDY28656.1 phage tail protein [Lachnotalea glycerini]
MIPEVIYGFNVYKSGNKLIGLSGEVTLPDFEAMTDTINGAGILGEFDTSILGMFGSNEIEIPFRALDEDIFSFMDPTEMVDLNLRATKQMLDETTAAVDFKSMRIAIRGKLKKFKPGKVQQATQMDSSVTLEVLYFLIEMDGQSKFELDKLNFIYKVNGKDILEKVRKFI